MNDPVDTLKKTLGAETDIGLAAMLGIERSTVAQWRRRGSVPVRYEIMLEVPHRDTVSTGMRHALRRQLYGDGGGRFLLAAALAATPLESLDFPAEIGAGNVGWSRETRLLDVVNVVLSACNAVLGKARCDTDAEFVKLIGALEEPEWRDKVTDALRQATVGEHP